MQRMLLIISMGLISACSGLVNNQSPETAAIQPADAEPSHSQQQAQVISDFTFQQRPAEGKAAVWKIKQGRATSNAALMKADSSVLQISPANPVSLQGVKSVTVTFSRKRSGFGSVYDKELTLCGYPLKNHNGALQQWAGKKETFEVSVPSNKLGNNCQLNLNVRVALKPADGAVAATISHYSIKLMQ